LTQRRRDYRDPDQLCVSGWSSIFGSALDQQRTELALEIIKKFQFARDRASILEYREDDLEKLPKSPAREKLMEYFAETSMGAYLKGKKSFNTLLKEKRFDEIEAMLHEFDSRPAGKLAQVVNLLNHLHADRQGERVSLWLDRILQSAVLHRSGNQQLLELFLAYDRQQDVLAYFGPLRCLEKQAFRQVALTCQPLCQMAIETAKAGNKIRTVEILSAIDEPVWRSGTLAELSRTFQDTDPELAQQWLDESVTLLKSIKNGDLHDYRLRLNCKLLPFEQNQVLARELLSRFEDQSRAAGTLADWLLDSLSRDELPQDLLRPSLDRVAKADPRSLLDVVT